jgi:hypothetical protein
MKSYCRLPKAKAGDCVSCARRKTQILDCRFHEIFNPKHNSYIPVGQAGQFLKKFETVMK